MRKLISLWLISTLISSLGFVGVAQAASLAPGKLVIREVLLGTASDASDEYVVIANNTSESLQLQGLEIDYKSASGTTWIRRAIVTSSYDLPPAGNLSFTTKRSGDLALNSGLAAAGGNLRLIWNGQVLDQLAWGTGNAPEGEAVSAPATGQPLARQCDLQCQDSGNNAADFAPINQIGGAAQAAADTAGQSAYDIEITELLPDPVSPLTDAKDEYIELYNAGTTTAQLTGWQLVNGKTKFKLDAVTIAPRQYVVLKSATTKLSLNNSGDEVQLIAANGEVVMTTPNYGKALAGVSFGSTPAGWGWLEANTPGAANSGLAQKQTADGQQKTSKPSASKSKKTTKAKTTKLAKVSAQKTGNTTSDDAAEAASKSTSWAWVLAVLGVLAVGYGAYEYRNELLSYYQKLRAKFTART